MRASCQRINLTVASSGLYRSGFSMGLYVLTWFENVEWPQTFAGGLSPKAQTGPGVEVWQGLVVPQCFSISLFFTIRWCLWHCSALLLHCFSLFSMFFLFLEAYLFFSALWISQGYLDVRNVVWLQACMIKQKVRKYLKSESQRSSSECLIAYDMHTLSSWCTFARQLLVLYIIIRNHLNIPKFVIVTKSWNLIWVVACTSAFTRIPQCFKGKVNDTVIMYLIRYCSSFLPILKNRDQDVPIADYPTTPLDPVRSTDTLTYSMTLWNNWDLSWRCIIWGRGQFSSSRSDQGCLV